MLTMLLLIAVADAMPRLFVAFTSSSDSSGTFSAARELSVSGSTFINLPGVADISLGSGAMKSLDADQAELMLYWVDGSEKVRNIH